MSIYDWALTPSANANADAGINWAEGQSPSTVNNSARAMMAALRAGFNDIAGVSELGGAGDTFALSLSQPMASLTNAVVGFFATRTNTGAVTLNVDGLGAKPLRFASGVNLTASKIISGAFYVCAYNPDASEWLIVGKHLVTNADMDQMAAGTVKGNLGGSAAAPSDVSIAALAAALGPGIPTGLIAMWSGTIATIPSDWHLCDGTNGTPDLRDRFVIGASTDSSGVAKTTVTVSATTSGGSKDAIAVAHTHTGSTESTGAHTHNISTQVGTFGSGSGFGNIPNGGGTMFATESAGAHSHSFTTDSTGSSGTNANLPPYYALAFIMKT